jgi:hypothetical protein
VSVIQSTKNGADGNAAIASYCARERRILVQRQVHSTLIVILLVQTQQIAQMPFAKNNDMVEALTSDGADQPLRVSVLPRRTSRESADRERPLHECAG